MGGLSLIWLSKCKENWWSSLVRELKEAELSTAAASQILHQIKLFDWLIFEIQSLLSLSFYLDFLGNSYGQKFLQASQALFFFNFFSSLFFVCHLTYLSICPSNTRSRSQPQRCAGSGRKSVPAVSNAREERCALAQSKLLACTLIRFQCWGVIFLKTSSRKKKKKKFNQEIFC